MDFNQMNTWLQAKCRAPETTEQARRLDHMLGILLATARWGNPRLPSSFETQESSLHGGELSILFCEAKLWLTMGKTSCRLEGDGVLLTSTENIQASAALFHRMREVFPLYVDRSLEIR